ncbi:hypothetical protein O0I10_004351 [Lichtheimia ornata]|uniref:Uncharacterized protein n=1 Tax=Lichtheimia ornata TaxID=688661 RepID=A0AAD7V711_9FUNG|nr:uncharacterized protein O0I10_004351 [Lichtheimia ornata]KAJ8659758.1 hypothetical protein O0I10_004351 [Lichtheimia ornata]
MQPDAKQATNNTTSSMSNSINCPVITATSSSSSSSHGAMRQPLRRPPPIRHDPLARSTTASTLMESDRTSIEFTRCLYQAKNIVKELERFSESICPALKVSPFNGFSAASSLDDPRLCSKDFVAKVNRYLDDTFNRFSRLCRVLLMVLEKMQRSPDIRRERVVSFRTEVMEQIRIAEIIRLRIISYIQQRVDESSRTAAASSSSMPTVPITESPSDPPPASPSTAST